jgi:Zn-dependent peptidase ImmA (M78 family)
MTDLPVKGEVLQWARKFRKLSEREAADMLGIAVKELQEFESEKRPVTIGILENFSSKYHLPQATLFRLTPPDEPPEPQDFRTEGGKRRRDSFEFRLALSNVRTWLSQYGRIIVDDDEFETPEIPLITTEEKADLVGERERKRFGITPEQQLAWPREEAFRRWRASLEMRGINVFQQKFPIDNCKGFTLYESADSPVIVVNKIEELDVAKIFTLMHEYCHLLLRKPGISDENSADPVEAYCNKFAAAFLMPTEVLRLLLPFWPNKSVVWEVEQINNWASRLKVSRVSLAYRLEHLGVAPKGFGRRFEPSRKIPKIGRDRSPRVDPTVVLLSEVGGNYARSVISALDRNIIDEAHAVEALGISEHNLHKARTAAQRTLELAKGG